MSPFDRKVELMRRGLTVSEIARRLSVSHTHVSNVVAGKRRSPRVEEAVAAAIERPIADVFPPADDAQAAAAGAR